MPLPWFVSDPDPGVYLTDNYLVLDLETLNHDKGSALNPMNDIVLAAWRLGKGHPSYGKQAEGHQWGGEIDQAGLLSLIGQTRFIVAHNSKFELQWLRRCGLDLRSVLPYDTLLAEYVIAGNRKVPLALDASSSRHGLGFKHSGVASLIHAGVSPADIPRALLAPYCKQDVQLAEALFLAQRVELARDGLLPVAYCRNLVTPVLAHMEEKGMHLDKARVLETHIARVAELGTASEAFAQFTGGINPRSPKQLRDYLYGKLGFAELLTPHGRPDRTPSGNARTDRHAIHSLRADTDEQQQFKRLALEVAKHKKPVENLEKMKAVLDAGGTTVYAQFNQAVTGTHRLSSSGRGGGFQFHNFDRAFKPLFASRRDGWVVVEADAPQLEFRVAADLGGDRQAVQDIIEEVDIHAFTASVIGTSRQNAKAHTFKPLYGGQSGTPEQKKYYEAFREKYRGIYETQRGWTFEVLKSGQLVTPWGLKFYWPDTKMKEGGYITNTPSIFNYPVQSFATADIIPLTLVLIWHSIKGMEGFLVNTIHDSVIGEFPIYEIPEYSRILVKSFTEDIYWLVEKLYGIHMSVPLGVGIKAASHWGEGEEVKHNGKAHAADFRRVNGGGVDSRRSVVAA